MNIASFAHSWAHFALSELPGLFHFPCDTHTHGDAKTSEVPEFPSTGNKQNIWMFNRTSVNTGWKCLFIGIPASCWDWDSLPHAFPCF